MSNHARESSLPVLSHADGIATSASDVLLLVGRVLLGWLFLTSAWGKFMNMGGYVAYLTNLKVPNPGFFLLDRRSGRILDRHYSDFRFCHPLRHPVVSPLPHRRHRTRPPLLGISSRPGDGPVQQLPQKSCALRRHLSVVRDRCGPLQRRSSALEEGLNGGGLTVRSTILCWQAARPPPALRALPT
jgi:hypothetical protein